MIESGEWIELPQLFKRIGRNEAEQSIDFFNDYDRSRGEKLYNAMTGFIGEAWHNYIKGDLNWWAAKRLADRTARKTDIDTKEGEDVKTVLEGYEYVCVNNTHAKEYIVYELTEDHRMIRYRGRFCRDDIGPITLRDGTKANGISVDALR